MVENLSNVDRADVYKGERLAGSLAREGGDVVFRYDATYLQDPGAPQVAWTIPTSSTEVRASGGSVPPFFAGLLPEGIRLRGAVAATKTSEDDHLTILMAVGADTIGDVRVLPAGAPPPETAPVFDPDAVERQDLRALFEQMSGHEAVKLDPTSLPGVQAKVSAQMYSTPIATDKGPAILKLSPPQGYPQLVENEHFFMGLAAKCGLPVADHQLVRDGKGNAGLLVARFDRRVDPSGRVIRTPQEDACQVMGMFPAAKYRLKTESVITALAGVCERGGGSARVATLELLRLVAYSYAIGNGDLHGKNFSVQLAASGLWSVTPAYDLLCTQPYLGWRDPMALDFYGKANKLNRRHFVESGGRLGVPERAVTRMLDGVRKGIGRGIEEIETIGFTAKENAQLRTLMERRSDELG
ncbi:type II toxin-antitoxin system HipA family toxin [Rhodococcus sp. JVH1]|jgi:serine/threonine-protein kinase HipA|uniref:type II toxin-antitoxin system HipA family toxin n=1 Tax=Rhodococcus sp. JVH1 TaxID=745408 RepID=UPI0002722190|nr:HipA domain-containing protein [Rhodococcus sp. JVH1]EJI99721.1 hipA N-terminal domain protein [Rhodococcus sp. JVH1]